jgi:hypothetical protein
VPAVTNNSTPSATTQIRFCSSHFAIMRWSRRSRGQHGRAVIRQTCGGDFQPWPLPGSPRQSSFFAKAIQ